MTTVVVLCRKTGEGPARPHSAAIDMTPPIPGPVTLMDGLDPLELGTSDAPSYPQSLTLNLPSTIYLISLISCPYLSLVVCLATDVACVVHII